GWTRIGITLAAGAVLALLMAQRSSPPAVLLVAALLVGLTLWTWMGQHTRFIVDEHGLTVSLGGFLQRRPWRLEDVRTVQLRGLRPRRPWPLETLRPVHLRELPLSRRGVSLGGYVWRHGRASTPRPEELTPVGTRKIFTLDEIQQPYRMLVTCPGTLVEIIGR